MSLPIARPPWSKVGKKCESKLRKALYDFEMLPSSGKVAIALSGGKDSLSLLYFLKAISGRGFPPLTLHAFHVYGEFSCGAGLPKGYVEAICRELEIGITCLESQQNGENLECYSCSRERRSLLFRAAKELGFDTMAFGHHKDDNAQTVLMNLLHKGEFAGNLPKLTMHHYGITIIRPLILIGEEEIRTFSEQHGFARITCQCPVGQVSKRKDTQKIIEKLEQVFPNARNNLASASLLYGSSKASDA